MATRISKASLAQFPVHVQDCIRGLQKRFHCASFSQSAKPEGKGFYLGEGDYYWVFYPGNETPVAIRMGAEHTLGASGLNWAIGGQIVPPGGSIVLSVSYLGKYSLSVETYERVPVEV